MDLALSMCSSELARYSEHDVVPLNLSNLIIEVNEVTQGVTGKVHQDSESLWIVPASLIDRRAVDTRGALEVVQGLRLHFKHVHMHGRYKFCDISLDINNISKD